MNPALLFLSSFFSVFLMGTQHFNVANKRYFAAFLTSVLIGLTSVVALKLAPNGSPLELFAFIMGAPLGITLSIYLGHIKKQPPSDKFTMKMEVNLDPELKKQMEDLSDIIEKLMKQDEERIALDEKRQAAYAQAIKENRELDELSLRLEKKENKLKSKPTAPPNRVRGAYGEMIPGYPDLPYPPKGSFDRNEPQESRNCTWNSFSESGSSSSTSSD